MPKARTITSRGQQYKLKPSADLATRPSDDESLESSIWISRNTYARGYSKAPAQSLPQVQINA